MSIKYILLLVYWSFYFLVSIFLDCLIYERTKKDNSVDRVFYLLIIFRILDKYNISLLDIIPCFTLGAESLIMLPLRAYESALNKLENNDKVQLILNFKKRLNKLFNY